MAKRKAAVNDIIYELDNEDIDISSDDEVKEPKINRLETVNNTINSQNEEKNKESGLELSNDENTPDEITEVLTPATMQNGGKITTDENGISETGTSSQQTEDEVDYVKKISSDCSKTTILNEDIVIDSPGNSDLGVEGCENRTPLITVRFRDKKLAKSYKEQVKAFMLNLIKLHEGETLGSDNETDVELDIWPEDLAEEEFAIEAPEENSLFFVDTDPCADQPDDIPRYSQASTVISNIPDKEPTPPPLRRGPCCFNCDGSHPLRDCVLPRDFARIAEKRKTMNSLRVGRYHVEDEQKYGHLIPGRISGQLRHALGLKRNELPLHIYRMRLLGYPPGWLEEARISHSGISMFDSAGNAILEPEEEEGEVCEPGSKDKFDIKKILDFPGFNVPASSRYIEEAHQFGLPPLAEQDSKMSMLQFLAPNAMKAYKRKKLTFFPSASANTTLEGQAEMDLDSGDEIAEFPSNPPLPDEAPPPPPPPPACPPPPPACPPPPPESPASPPADESPATPKSPAEDKTESSGDDVEVTKVIQIGDIPIPVSELITIDDDANSQNSGRESPSLDDLEEKKRLLLSALEGDVTLNSSIICILDTTEENIEDLDKTIEIEKIDPNDVISVNDDNSQENIEIKADDNDNTSTAKNNSETRSQELESNVQTPENPKEIPSPKDAEINDVKSQTSADIPSTPESKPGHVKDTAYGTPVMNIASPYDKLPTDEKFAKDICDVINFENLPNSTGKYKQISALLRKVKSEVDRIQES